MNKRMRESLFYFHTITRIIVMITFIVFMYLWAVLKLFIPNFTLTMILFAAVLFIHFSPKPIQSEHEATKFLHILSRIEVIITIIMTIFCIIVWIFALINKYS